MYTVYKITNIINNRYYIGVHKTKNNNDNYMGSGIAIKRSIKKYGIDNFKKEILFSFIEKEDAYNKEQVLLEECLNDVKCYNLNCGGIGGFEYINSNRDKFINPMFIEDNRKKMSTSLKQKRNENKKYYDEISINNLKKIKSKKGVKRPNHSELMKEKSYFKSMWKDKEKTRDLLSSYFTVTSPDGETYTTNRLQDFCIENNLGYGALWNSSRTLKKVIKGKSKGWMCKKYDRN